MYIIVGLGNPGKKYANTRHNMGFMTIDKLSEDLSIDVKKIKFKAEVGEGKLAHHKVLLVKPQTFMNLSGESVQEIVNFYKIPHENLIVIYDDLDIDVGTIRIRKKGSAGTHNGMKSVVGRLGFEDFPRIRIGIGSNKNRDIIDYVIGGFAEKERDPLNKAIVQSAKAVESIIIDGIDKAMNKYNGNC